MWGCSSRESVLATLATALPDQTIKRSLFERWGRGIAIADDNRQTVVSIPKDETTDVSRSYSYAPFTCMFF
jgi:hypothetical protein